MPETPDKSSIPRPAEPLPGDFDPRQVEVDRLLTQRAQVDARCLTPEGLSRRVYEMTASMLPTPVAGDVQTRLRLVNAEAYEHAVSPRGRAYARWGRMALAASVFIAAGATLWTTVWQSPDIGTNAQAPTEDTGRAIQTAAFDLNDLHRFDAGYTSDIDAYQNNFSYLLEASEVRSFDDLSDDLRRFVAHLEM